MQLDLFKVEGIGPLVADSTPTNFIAQILVQGCGDNIVDQIFGLIYKI